MAKRNPPWTYEELVLALELYLRRGLVSPDDSELLELSDALNQMGAAHAEDPPKYRNPNGVHLKLANYRAREHPGHGMSHGNHLEETVWNRFHGHRDLLVQEAKRIRSAIASKRR